MFSIGAAAVPPCSASSSLQIDNKMHTVHCTCYFPHGMDIMWYKFNSEFPGAKIPGTGSEYSFHYIMFV